MIGNGIIASVRNARRLVAHWSPSLWYIWIPNNGKAAYWLSASAKSHLSDVIEWWLTAKTASSKAIGRQRGRCIEWICINQECKYTTKNKKSSNSVVSHRYGTVGMNVCSSRVLYENDVFRKGLDILRDSCRRAQHTDSSYRSGRASEQVQFVTSASCAQLLALGRSPRVDIWNCI